MKPPKPDVFSDWTFEEIAKRWWSYRDFTDGFRKLFNDADEEYKFKRRVVGYLEQRQKNRDFDVNGRYDPYQKGIGGGALFELEAALFGEGDSEAEGIDMDTMRLVLAAVLASIKDLSGGRKGSQPEKITQEKIVAHIEDNYRIPFYGESKMKTLFGSVNNELRRISKAK